MDNLTGLLLMPGLFLLLQLAGLVLALAFWSRCPSACALLFLGSLLSMLANVGRVGLMLVHPDGNLPFLGFIPMISILNWVAYALMLLAIFAGRNEPTRPSLQNLPPDDDWHAPVQSSAPVSTKDTTGIQTEAKARRTLGSSDAS